MRVFFGYRYMEIEFEEDDARAEVETQAKLGGFVDRGQVRFLRLT